VEAEFRKVVSREKNKIQHSEFIMSEETKKITNGHPVVEYDKNNNMYPYQITLESY
jgi:hypothetical protein